MTATRHGNYNGWCRVEGIPVKWSDCPECLSALREAVASGDPLAILDVLGLAATPLSEGEVEKLDQIAYDQGWTLPGTRAGWGRKLLHELSRVGLTIARLVPVEDTDD